MGLSSGELRPEQSKIVLGLWRQGAKFGGLGAELGRRQLIPRREACRAVNLLGVERGIWQRETGELV